MTNYSTTTNEANSTSNFVNLQPITNHAQLVLRISELRAIKQIQEEELKFKFKRITNIFNLLSYFKSETFENNPLGLMKSGANLVLNLIVEQIFGKSRSLKGFLSSVMVERIINFIIENNFMNIISGISHLFHKTEEPE